MMLRKRFRKYNFNELLNIILEEEKRDEEARLFQDQFSYSNGEP
jgi:hypothetical protein